MKAEQPKRLGRGLAALMGEDAVPAGAAAAGVQSLAVEMLEPSPYQPRRAMDETALGELADSITQRGILQPLLVRPHPEKRGHYQIIAGERRWRAAQKAQLHEVPVLVRDLSNNDAMAAGLVENLQREDLNAVEEAQGYQRLITEFKMTQESLGDALGKSRTHINTMVRLLKLPEKVLAMLQDGTLSPGHGRALLAHIDPLKAARLIVQKNMSVRQAEQYVNDLGRTFKNGLDRRPAPPRRSTPDTDAVAERLTETLGLKVKIVFDGRKAGSVTLNYTDLDQLDAILTLLNG